MGLEVVLKNSNTSGKSVFTYEFDVQNSDRTKYGDIKRALNLALARAHNGNIVLAGIREGSAWEEETKGVHIARGLTSDPESRLFSLLYEEIGGNVFRASIVVANADAEMAHALIDYWDTEIRRGESGKIGKILAQTVREVTETLDVVVKYQD